MIVQYAHKFKCFQEVYMQIHVNLFVWNNKRIHTKSFCSNNIQWLIQKFSFPSAKYLTCYRLTNLVEGFTMRPSKKISLNLENSLQHPKTHYQ